MILSAKSSQIFSCRTESAAALEKTFWDFFCSVASLASSVSGHLELELFCSVASLASSVSSYYEFFCSVASLLSTASSLSPTPDSH